jgi:dTDP-4-amino-4,6-dideoxygalactose transaminase
MIPRYAPTYSYRDLFQSIRLCNHENIIETLRTRLSVLYNKKHVFIFDSARIALYALLKAYNRPGGVLMPAYTCIVVPEAVCYAGYQPQFVDIDCRTLNVHPEILNKSISSHIKVVLVTHLLGVPADLDKNLDLLRQHDVLIVEDAAPAIGAEYHGKLVGQFGDAAIISFQSTKVISAETGGALLTNDDDLAAKIERLYSSNIAPRNNWHTFFKATARKIAMSAQIYPVIQAGYRALRHAKMYEVVPPHKEIPTSFIRSCSPFACSLFLVQLDRLDKNLKIRRRLAQIYKELLADHPGIQLPLTPESCSPSWIQFSILANDKWAFYQHMQRHKVDLSWTYRYSCADSYGLENFPNARYAAKAVLGFPTYPSLTDEQAQYICGVARKYKPSGKRSSLV